MTARETGTEFEQLRTQVEELDNALSRIIDVLRDNYLSESERIERAVAIAEMSKAWMSSLLGSPPGVNLLRTKIPHQSFPHLRKKTR